MNDIKKQGPAAKQEASLGKRYIVKLISNIATIPLHLLMEMILPRALGPATYGNYTFTISVFQNIINFFDMGSSTCLNTSLAKRPEEFGLASFYARIAFCMLVLCLITGGMFYLPGVGEWILPGVPLWLVFPVALWTYLSWSGSLTRGLNDALGVTMRSELVRISVNLLSATALLALFFNNILTLKVFFLHQYVFQTLMLAGFLWSLKICWMSRDWRLSSEQVRDYARTFIKYSSPLFIISLCSMFAIFGERWMLQLFGGSVQQGFFSLSQKIGIACFMFVTAMTPLIMRELSVAHGRKDTAAMGRLLDRFAPMIYSVAAWLSCFAAVETIPVVRFFGGAEFVHAVAAVQIMALYPIHQAYGQVASSIFYASGETRTLRNVLVISLTLGLLCSWLFMAPQELGGLELGALGLAYKMVILQVLTVNVLLFIARRVAPFNFWRNLLHQVVCPLSFCALAIASGHVASVAGVSTEESAMLRIFVSGSLYAFFSLGAVLLIPFIAGVSREEIHKQSKRIVQYIKI